TAPPQTLDKLLGGTNRDDPAGFTRSDEVRPRTVGSGEYGDRGRRCLGQHRGIAVVDGRIYEYVAPGVHVWQRRLRLARRYAGLVAQLSDERGGLPRAWPHQAELVPLRSERAHDRGQVPETLLERECSDVQYAQRRTRKDTPATLVDDRRHGAKHAQSRAEGQPPQPLARDPFGQEAVVRKCGQGHHPIGVRILAFLTRDHPAAGTVLRRARPRLLLPQQAVLRPDVG